MTAVLNFTRKVTLYKYVVVSRLAFLSRSKVGKGGGGESRALPFTSKLRFY